MKKYIFLFLLLVGSIMSSAQNLDSMLLLYYPFSGNANDASGNGYHGTVYNATLANDRFGNPNSAYYFNGVSSYIEFPNIAALKPPLPVSLAFWIKLNDYAEENTRVLTTSYSLNSYCGICVNTHGGIVGFGYGDGTPNSTGPQNRRSKSGTTVMQLNQWYFVVMVIRGAQNMDLYINCINDGGTYSGTGGSMAYSTNSGSLGRYDMWSLAPSYFFGYLDEFRYWNRALTQADIDLMCAMQVDAGPDYEICLGDSITLGGSPSISGNTPPFTWSWSPTTDLDDPMSQNPTATPSTTTTYTFQVTDHFGQTQTDSVTVTVLPNQIAVILPVTDYCNNNQPDTLFSQSSGGIWWGNGITDSVSGVFSPSIAGAGTHQVFYGYSYCGDTTSVFVNVYEAPIVFLGQDTTICQGDSIVLDAGTGMTNYDWSPAWTNQTLTVVSSGTYSVTVTNADLCSATDEINITFLPQQDASVSPAIDYCSNITPDTLTSLNPGGTWWGNGIIDSIAGVFDPLTAGLGTHFIYYGFEGLCGDTTNISITVFPSPIVNIGHDTAFCTGGSINLDAGPGMVNYAWTPAGNTQTINVNTPGTYSVEVTDANTCLGFDTVVVSEIPWANATINPVSFYCTNHPTDTLTSTQTGGIWWGNGIINSAVGVFDPQTAGVGIHPIYYGIAGMCGDTSSLNITVLPAPVVNLGPDIILCSGDSITLDAGSGMLSYIWAPSGNSQTITVGSSGSYSVTVSDATTCLASDQINIIVLPQADATISNPGQFCNNSPAVNFSAAQTGGTWSGTGITNTSTGTFDPAVAGAGTHSVYYSIAGICGDADSIDVTVLQASDINLGQDTAFCQGGSVLLDAGAGMTQYVWNPLDSSQTITVSSSGIYSVTITASNLCQNIDSITITVIPWADATISNPGQFCNNSPAVNFSAAQTGGTWSGTGITNTSTGTFNPAVAGAGTHSVYYSIAGMCGDTDSIDVTVVQTPDINLGQDTAFCQGGSVLLDAGAGMTQYVWNPLDSSQTITVSSSGIYSVTITDANLCQNIDSITITVIPWADATISNPGQFCNNSPAVNFSAAQTGGTWSGTGITNTSTGTFDPAVAGAGTHSVYYSIAGMCGDADSIDVTVWSSPIVVLFQSDETCIDAGDGWAYTIITDGTEPYQIIWSNSETSDTITGLEPGNYEIFVTDTNGCSSAGSILIASGTEDCFPSSIYIPNIFSPNGDGENDVLYVRGENIQYLEFIIYDRWGEILFETTDQGTGWDGTYQGRKCDPAVFVYTVKVTFFNQSQIAKNGNITLVR